MDASSTQLRRLAAQAARHLGPQGHQVIAQLLEAAGELEERLVEQAQRIRQLENLSNSDELTGALNRRGFALAFEGALAAAHRHGHAGMLLLCDLDHFKAINDVYGHLAGDAVLRAVVRRLRKTTRRSDQVARLGGDEFAVLMPNTPRQQAQALVAKLDRLVNRLVIDWQGHAIPVSASCGCECFGPDSRTEIVMFLADRALYRNKAGAGARFAPARA